MYSHRSTFLHALSGQAATLTGPTDKDKILTFVPMFHVNAWGVPFTSFMSGASLHLPGPFMSPEGICAFISAERPTLAAAVPTIWQGILQYGQANDIDLSSLRMGTSGGEWISSVELENLLAGCPGVLEAAVIGIPDEKWTERPLACVVMADVADHDPARLAHYLGGRVARWQVPENWTFITDIPKTTVGKYDKKLLRAKFKAGELSVWRLKD